MNTLTVSVLDTIIVMGDICIYFGVKNENC